MRFAPAPDFLALAPAPDFLAPTLDPDFVALGDAPDFLAPASDFLAAELGDFGDCGAAWALGDICELRNGEVDEVEAVYFFDSAAASTWSEMLRSTLSFSI